MPLDPGRFVAMLPRGFWTRLGAGALTVWFGLVTAAPAVLHGCPRAMAEAATAEAPDAGAHHHHGAPGQQGQSSDLPDQCACLGTCALAAAAVLAAAPAVPAPVELPHAGGARAVPADLAPASTSAHLLPFATAPPFQAA